MPFLCTTQIWSSFSTDLASPDSTAVTEAEEDGREGKLEPGHPNCRQGFQLDDSTTTLHHWSNESNAISSELFGNL